MAIPMQHNVDMDNPREHVLWALVAIGGDAPLLMPRQVMEDWAEHLYRAGFRHHPELQEIYYRPPSEDASIWDSLSGEWVESETPGNAPQDYDPDDLDALVDGMDERLKAALRERLGGDG